MTQQLGDLHDSVTDYSAWGGATTYIEARDYFFKQKENFDFRKPKK